MAKPDWGELQQRFLSDHATTGISPKDWCEAQGLNYTSAHRYIKKPTIAHCATESVRKKNQLCKLKIKLIQSYRQLKTLLLNGR